MQIISLETRGNSRHQGECQAGNSKGVVSQVSAGKRSGTGKVKPFDPARVNYRFVVTNNENVYLFPSTDIKARRALNLGEKYVQYKVEW